MATNLVPVFAMLYAIISLLKWSMTVYLLAEPRIVVGCRPDERVEGVGDEAAAHHSQKVVEQTKEYTIFSYFLRITFDFRQELLTMGDCVEVMEPQSLRKEMASIGRAMAKAHAGTAKKGK